MLTTAIDNSRIVLTQHKQLIVAVILTVLLVYLVPVGKLVDGMDTDGSMPPLLYMRTLATVRALVPCAARLIRKINGKVRAAPNAAAWLAWQVAMVGLLAACLIVALDAFLVLCVPFNTEKLTISPALIAFLGSGWKAALFYPMAHWIAGVVIRDGWLEKGYAWFRPACRADAMLTKLKQALSHTPVLLAATGIGACIGAAVGYAVGISIPMAAVSGGAILTGAWLLDATIS